MNDQTKSNEELRVAVAKARGWRARGKDDWSRWQTAMSWYAYPLGARDLRKLPNWPENIADAWGLWDEMAAWYGAGIWLTPQSGGKTMVTISGASEEFGRDKVFFGTAPRAITLAWLAWKESQP